VKSPVAVALAALVAASCSGSAATRTPLPRFDHVLVVVLENKSQSNVLGNENAPNFNGLAKRYALLSGYGGVTHPSLPNYLALVSGSTHGITSDCTTCIVSARNLADTLERAHLTWKGYAEGLPRRGFTGGSAGRYAKKHMPFLYFRDVVSKPARLRRVVSLRQFGRDLAAGALPSFSLIVPDMCHDMHDCSVETGDAWLGGFLSPLLRSRKLGHSVIFVITDEPATGQAS
jgi:phospholipase C